eukprot:COSAG06_NODE_22905_length_709_cov_1.137705_1_plen_76_part_10
MQQQQSDEKEDAEEEEEEEEEETVLPEGVRWKVGDVIKHATYGYTGESARFAVCSSPSPLFLLFRQTGQSLTAAK